MSRCMCGHHANGSRPAAWCERRDMRDGDLALSGGRVKLIPPKSATGIGAFWFNPSIAH